MSSPAHNLPYRSPRSNPPPPSSTGWQALPRETLRPVHARQSPTQARPQQRDAGKRADFTQRMRDLQLPRRDQQEKFIDLDRLRWPSSSNGASLPSSRAHGALLWSGSGSGHDGPSRRGEKTSAWKHIVPAPYVSSPEQSSERARDRIKSTRLMPPAKGEYTSRRIAARLGAIDAHSFLCARPREAGDKHSGRLVAIMYHKDAHPAPPDDKTFVIWTRHNKPPLEAHLHVPLPLFHYTDSPASNLLWAEYHRSHYTFKGTYKILAVEKKPGHSIDLLEFVMLRKESSQAKPKEIWNSKLRSDWWKVTVVRCDDSEQLPNPMVDGGQ